MKNKHIIPFAGLTSVIANAGRAVVIVVGPIQGGYVVNPANAAAQSLPTMENLYVDPVNPPGSTDAMAHGTTMMLEPGQDYDIPPLDERQTLWANAATAGHTMTVVVWSMALLAMLILAAPARAAGTSAGPGPLPTSIACGSGLACSPASPITGQGTISISGTPVPGTANANTILAGPASGGAAAPIFRSLGLTDLPTQTGTGLIVLNNSPTLVAPALVAPILGTATGTSLQLPATAASGLQVGVSVDTIAPVAVSANTNTSPPAPSANTLIHFIGKDATAVIFQTDSYGGTPIVRYDRYDGTSSSRTALVSGDGLGSFQFGGWDGAALAQPVSIIPTTSENWSGTAHGASLSFSINPVTTTTSTGVMLLDGINTSVDIGGSTLANSSLTVFHTASAVNHVQINGAVTGSQPTITSNGTGTEAGLTIGVRGGTLNLTPVSIAMPNISTSNTPTAYACFDAGNNLFKSAVPC